MLDAEQLAQFVDGVAPFRHVGADAADEIGDSVVWVSCGESVEVPLECGRTGLESFRFVLPDLSAVAVVDGLVVDDAAGVFQADLDVGEVGLFKCSPWAALLAELDRFEDCIETQLDLERLACFADAVVRTLRLKRGFGESRGFPLTFRTADFGGRLWQRGVVYWRRFAVRGLLGFLHWILDPMAVLGIWWHGGSLRPSGAASASSAW